MADRRPFFHRAFRAPLHPDLGWGAATLAVLGAMVLPALVSFPFVMNFPNIEPGTSQGATNLIWFAWHVAATLTISPTFFIVILILATPALWLLLWFRWAGFASLILLAWSVGLPAVHVTFNGDVTTEAPDLIPVVALALAVQAVTGGIILKMISFRKNQKSLKSNQIGSVSPQK